MSNRGAVRHAVPVPAHSPADRLGGEVRAGLRLEVGRLRQRESRRVFDASVHVGVPGVAGTGFVVRAQDGPALDAALRIDVVSTLLDDSRPDWTTLWLVRAGSPEPYDCDLAWWAAAGTAFGMHGRRLDGGFVVTRSGWRDVRTGETREWVRLRL